MSAAENTAASAPEKDPIVEGSLLWPIFISMLVLLVVSGWSLYDEFYTRRPYKNYQNDWVDLARRAYQGKMADAQSAYDLVANSPEYLALRAAWVTARDEAAGPYAKLQDQLNKEVAPRLAVLGAAVKGSRSEVAALTYRLELAREHKNGNDERYYAAALGEVKDVEHVLEFPGDETVTWKFKQMLGEFNRLKALQGRIQGRMAEVKTEESRTRNAMNEHMDAHIVGPKPDAVAALIDGVDNFEHDIKQIHIKYEDGELIERCESCHLGIRSPVALSLPEVLGRKEFVSHPNQELLDIHDPEVMGCSPCHGGNGVATASVWQAHGRYKYWLWPLHYPANTEAGCVQCHEQDLHLDHATVINDGRQLFQWRGCVGCHRHGQFIGEEDEAKTLTNRRDAATTSIEATQIDIASLVALTKSENVEDSAIEAAFTRIEKQNQNLYLLQTEEEMLDAQLASLELEIKKVGPNLKEVAAKLKPEWVQPWLANPRHFRPSTKMPKFRFGNNEIDHDENSWNVAAFLWQASAPVKFPDSPADGDAEKGEWLITVRGCLGCHSVTTEEYGEGLGSTFASDLSRMGEKANYAYLVSWLKSPRDHNQYTIMPSLRLSDEDARDIASFLVSGTDEDAKYLSSEKALNELQDPARAKLGKAIVKHLGCAGCHEIKGLEKEDRVGTELTKEGSKPIERLDFGTLTHAYYGKKTYKHKWFFEDKLRDPKIWDTDKERPDYFTRLKMPEFFPPVEPRPDFPEGRARWASEIKAKIAAIDEDADDYDAQRAILEKPLQVYKDIDALTTFLLGSVAAELPPSLKYEPTGLKKDIQEGWWVIKKYNCEGCHQILPGGSPSIWQMPIYEDGEGFEGVPDKNGRPPTLVGQGTRTSPDWLMKFLDNPALTDNLADMHRNGVRQGLAARMPTFFFSERERGKIVRFFTAMANLSRDYQRPKVLPLTGADLELGRAAFTAGDCANCHLLGGEAKINPSTTYAPSFQPVAERIKPAWIHRWVTEPNSVIPKTAMPAILTKEMDDAGNIKRWVISLDEVNATARKRVGPEMMKRLADYTGDHADLLVRYFAYWNETEAEHQTEKRKIQ
ncbi:MAG: hypothetical protein CMJ83_10975 [Planctomycetes bacterium]|nr:hypothetical protein [Planctomycetota bacterium]